MDIIIHPQKLHGQVTAIPSKSQAHRLLICATFSDRSTTLVCPETNRDIAATADCLNALGANIQRTENGYTVEPITAVPEHADLHCGESGSTLRFLLPIAGALGVDAVFYMEGRLPLRPLSPLWEEMERMGCSLSRPSENTVRCTGKLRCGTYTIDAGVSSQFISGLLFAAALIPGSSEICLTGHVESAPYIEMTRQALEMFAVDTSSFCVTGKTPFLSPGMIIVEGDWSNAAFFLASKVLGSSVEVTNLNSGSLQGDRAVAQLLPMLNRFCNISAEDIPDLIPILSVVACANAGALFTGTRRLRLKESDRVEAVRRMLESLGCRADISENEILVHAGHFHGGTVETFGDHRIAMSAAIAATIADGPVTILGAECVTKSYPAFWDVYRSLGGNYEQYIR